MKELCVLYEEKEYLYCLVSYNLCFECFDYMSYTH